MSMNKKEQAALDKAIADRDAARALRWPEYDKPSPMTDEEVSAAPTIDVPTDWSGTRKAVPGWDYNEYAGEVFKVLRSGRAWAAHYVEGQRPSWSQHGRIFRTKADALRGLRYSLTVAYAEKLASIDRMIREMEGGQHE